MTSDHFKFSVNSKLIEIYLKKCNISNLDRHKVKRFVIVTLKSFLKNEYSKLVNYTRKQLREVFLYVDAEDIVHDVALNIFSKADVNTPIENLAGYFYRSIKNKVTDYQRASNNNRNKINQQEYHQSEDEVDAITAREHADEQIKMEENLKKAIDKLKPEQRLILFKTEFEGIPFNNLSEEWGIPLGTLLARKHRAIANLRKIMNEFDNT